MSLFNRVSEGIGIDGAIVHAMDAPGTVKLSSSLGYIFSASLRDNIGFLGATIGGLVKYPLNYWSASEDFDTNTAAKEAIKGIWNQNGYHVAAACADIPGILLTVPIEMGDSFIDGCSQSETWSECFYKGSEEAVSSGLTVGLIALINVSAYVGISALGAGVITATAAGVATSAILKHFEISAFITDNIANPLKEFIFGDELKDVEFCEGDVCNHPGEHVFYEDVYPRAKGTHNETVEQEVIGKIMVCDFGWWFFHYY